MLKQKSTLPQDLHHLFTPIVLLFTGKNDLPQVLRTPAPSGCELPQEEVRTFQPAAP